jgi:putative oxidoreductase
MILITFVYQQSPNLRPNYKTKKRMKIAVIIVRVLMGLLFLVSVIGYFFNLMPQSPMGESATLFITGLAASGYVLPIVKVIELVVAVALLTGRFVALAIVIIFPITLNILLFHALLAPEGVAMSVFLFIANLFLAYAYRKQYSSIAAIA